MMFRRRIQIVVPVDDGSPVVLEGPATIMDMRLFNGERRPGEPLEWSIKFVPHVRLQKGNGELQIDRSPHFDEVTNASLDQQRTEHEAAFAAAVLSAREELAAERKRLWQVAQEVSELREELAEERAARSFLIDDKLRREEREREQERELKALRDDLDLIRPRPLPNPIIEECPRELELGDGKPLPVSAVEPSERGGMLELPKASEED